MNIGIILAGGAGKRVGAIRPKQFINVLGKPVLAYTCEIFQETNVLMLLRLSVIVIGLITVEK